MNELLTKAFDTRKFDKVFSFPEILMNDFEREMLSWLRHYALKYGNLPTQVRFSRQFPAFAPIESEDPASDILDECVRRKKQALAQVYVTQINAAIQEGDDPTACFAEAHEILSAASANIYAYSTFDRREYFRSKKFLKFGMQIIDLATGGLGNGELAYIAGRLGSYKTTLIEHIAFRWWFTGHRVLFVSNEALPVTVFAHLDAIAGKFDSALLRQSTIPADIKAKILKVATRVSRNGSKYPFGEIIVPGERLMTPAKVFAMASHLKVDAIVIDGVYLMHADGASGFSQGWENMTTVSRALKQGAIDLKLRVLGILQRKRGSDSDSQTTEDIAYSDAFPQDADIVISLVKERNTLVAELIKNREGTTDVGTILEVDHQQRRLKDLKFNTHTVQEVVIPAATSSSHGETA